MALKVSSSGLSHPNIIKIYDTGEIDGVASIAMEPGGGSLPDRLAAGRRLWNKRKAS